jgi:hypothetical protein
MEDVPGQLATIAEVLGKKGVNIDYAYAFVTKTEKAFLIIRVNDLKTAVETLYEEGIPLLDMNDVQNI